MKKFGRPPGRPPGRIKTITLGNKISAKTKERLLRLVDLYVKKGKKKSQSLVIEDALKLLESRMTQTQAVSITDVLRSQGIKLDRFGKLGSREEF